MVTFFERLGAYFIDFLIVSLFLFVVGSGLPNNSQEINDEVLLLEEKYLNEEISLDVFLDESYELIYQQQKSMKLYNIVSVASMIAYFVVFQTLYNGQTFGKKLLKLKVVDNDSKKNIGMGRMFIRSLFTLNIFSYLINIILLLLVSKNMYVGGYLLAICLEYLFVFVTIIMILYRKDKRGLHDLMTRTCVVKEV